MRGAKENTELAEVRAILMKVQRLGSAPEEGPAAEDPVQTGSPAAKDQSSAPRPSDMGVFDRKHAAMQRTGPEAGSKASSKRAAVYLGAAGARIAAIVILFAAGGINVRDNYGAWSQESEAALLSGAHQLLSQGDVARARTSLLRGKPEARADVAFVLAQSYDPNYLQSLPNTNSLPDPSEAARWYKKWYELAVQSGLEMDAGRLQRIINAMQKH